MGNLKFTSAFTVIFSPFLLATAYCGTRFLNPSMILADFDSCKKKD